MKISRANKSWVPEVDFNVDTVFRPQDAKSLLDDKEVIIKNLLERIWEQARKHTGSPNTRFEMELDLGEIPVNTSQNEYLKLKMSLQLAELNELRSKNAIVDYEEFVREIGEGPWLEIVCIRIYYYPSKFESYISEHLGHKVSDKIEFDEATDCLIFGSKSFSIKPGTNEHYICLEMFKHDPGYMVPQTTIEDLITRKDASFKKTNKAIKDTLLRLNKKIKQNLGLAQVFQLSGEHIIRKI